MNEQLNLNQIRLINNFLTLAKYAREQGLALEIDAYFAPWTAFGHGGFTYRWRAVKV